MNIKKHITKFIMGDRIVLIKPENNYTNEDKAKVDSIDDLQKEVSDLQDIANNAEKNTIVTIKRNGTALTPDSNRAVDIKVPTKVSDLSNDMGYIEGGSFVEILIDTPRQDDPVIVTGGWENDVGEEGGYVLNLIGYDGIDNPEYPTVLVKGVGTPLEDNDAVNRAYVDSEIAKLREEILGI